MYMYIALSADACMEYIALVRSFICVIGGLQCYFIMKLNVVLLFTKLNWIKFCCFQFISVVTFLWLCRHSHSTVGCWTACEHFY